MIAPHRRGRTRPKTPRWPAAAPLPAALEGRQSFAWLGTFRQLVVRYERYALNYLGFVHIGCILILLRQGL